jgi:hypothetical protein
VIPADLVDMILAVSSSLSGGLGGAAISAAPGAGIASHDPLMPVTGWAWTEAPAAVADGSWAAVPAAADSLAAADGSASSSSEGPGAEAEPMPLGLDRIAESLSGNLAALDAALGQYLDRVDDLGDIAADMVAGARPVAWMMGAAVAVGAGVAIHRLARRRRRWATESIAAEALNPWALGPVPETV